MWRSRPLRVTVIALIGVAVALYVVRTIGLKPIFNAATTIGWHGFAALCLYQFGQFVLLGSAWCVLVPRLYRPQPLAFVWARMVRDATTELLPFSHLGGILCGVRAAIARGIAQPIAFGSLVADITAEMVAQVVFTAVGVAVLMASMASRLVNAWVTGTAVLGFLTLSVTCVVVLIFQRFGGRWPAKLVSRLFPRALPLTDQVIGCLREIYRRPICICLAVSLHFAGWLASAVSTWIALRFMGVQAALVPVIAIESLVCAVRSVGFWVPNGLGVQEVAYASIAPLLGIGAEIGLAISVLKRARDVVVGVPILLLWQWTESRRLLADMPLHRHSSAAAD